MKKSMMYFMLGAIMFAAQAAGFVFVLGDASIGLESREGMVYIPAGTAYIADLDFGTYSCASPGFYMDASEITKGQWDVVYEWAVSNGYAFSHVGAGKGDGHPVHTISWYDSVKWCNARSEMEGLTPCYWVNDAVYRTGTEDPSVDMNVIGYRLPTGEEWEYAARGGISERFSFGDQIDAGKANCALNGSLFEYDTSGYAQLTFHPVHADGSLPYTSPAGSYPPNGFGLYDMTGNVWEWCNGGTNGAREIRGGSWMNDASFARNGLQAFGDPEFSYYHLGFRCVLH
ncbi:formylglycine-generating enzyme family protein [Tichowtungia aerotolerans]|uniref:SUMF1/EgtB/PvdO family nonheme iron enzyme n=1 Tax=Tichowtungia aerotolerans TaxID=2697043 RepID=A0A6P1M2J0_9BACT|nr:SUMF1/EgtB/PvdO family nonheme iron enzyme [Tichowtungia aerotolerans]QHI69049.1 SUMF1/EgtB/PvdO family nonheme iron enzyme [Tichowtungia aerotolerans]